MAKPATSVHTRRRPLRLAPVLLAAVAALVVAGAPAASAVSGPNSVSVGLPPTAVAIDQSAHTAYVAVSDGVTDQVAIVDTSLCTAVPSAHCSGDVAAVDLAGNPGPAGVAYDPKNHTVYVTDSNTGGVSMINAATCNATKHSGCAATPKVAKLGLIAPGAVAVDTAGRFNAVYVADEGGSTVTAFSGKTCNANKTAGCKTHRTVTVGAAPSAIAVDPAVGTVYVANLGSDSVSILNEAACSTIASACKKHGAHVSLGTGTSPVSLVADPQAKTVFVADSGTGALSFLNTAKCSFSKKAGCAKAPRSEAGISDPEGLALLSGGRVAVANAGDDAVLVFGAAACNATKATGCLSVEADVLGGSPVAVATSGSRIYAADSTLSSLDIVGAPSIVARVTSKHAKTRFGWYRSTVTVTFSCHAGTAPLASTCPSPVTIKKNGKGRSVTGTVTSADGGSAAVDVTVNLDMTKPTVKVTGVTNGATYSVAPTLRCRAHDALSGIASCTIRRTHSGEVVHYVATAKDRAGNIARAHGKYRVS